MPAINGLLKKYPILFSKIRGFQCGDGWYDIIDKASAALEAINVNRPDHPVCASQVKEKFAGLRFYVSGTLSIEEYEPINEAERASYSTCEDCGAKGRRRSLRSYISTLCRKCYEGRKEEVLERAKAWQIREEEAQEKKKAEDGRPDKYTSKVPKSVTW